MNKLKKVISSKFNNYQQVSRPDKGRIGLADGSTVYTGAPFEIWVTLIDGTPVKVINQRLPNIWGTMVKIGFDPVIYPDRQQVLAPWDVFKDTTYVGTTTHGWTHARDGIDPTPDITIGEIETILGALTEKTTPVDADRFSILDSAASLALKYLTWANIKTTLGSIFAALTHTHSANDVVSDTLDGDRLPAMSASKLGGVPATGSPSGKYLKDDATWDSPAGGSGGDVYGDATATDGHLAVFDTDGYHIKDGGAIPVGSLDGWNSGTGTWSYSSADSPVFVVSIDNDQTGILQPGMRIKLTQSTGGTKYFIVHAVGSYSGGVTLVTFYGGTDYTLANEAISNPYWSNAKAPFGFPTNPTKWTVELTDISQRTQSSPTGGTWYNVGSLSISAPIGLWSVRFDANIETRNGSAATLSIYMALSTATNSASNDDLKAGGLGYGTYHSLSIYKEYLIAVAAKTTYYLNIETLNASTLILMNNNIQKCHIRLVDAYL